MASRKPLPLQNLRIIIARPKFSGNLGAIARLAANFDVKDLWVSAPRRPFDEKEASMYAMGPAQEYLKSMRFVDTLEDALADIPVAIALTRRVGQMRAPDIDIAQMAEKLKEHPVALVFGSEEGGLLAEEVAECQFIYRIPTSENMPSLNLSHAVGIMCARLFEEMGGRPGKRATKRLTRRTVPATHAELESMYDHWEEFLRDIGLTSAGNPERVMVKIRKIFARASLNLMEANALRGIISKAQKALGKK